MPTERLGRVRVYLTEADRSGGHPLDRALLDLLRTEGAAGATVFRGVEGFGARRRLHAGVLVDVAPELPLVVEWIDGVERVRRLLPRATALAAGSLVTLDDVASAAAGRGPGGLAAPGARTAGDGGTAMERGERAQRVRIYLGRDDRAGGRPAHLAILQLLQAGSARGATVLGGIEGFGARGELHGDRLADLGRKLPLVVEWIDRPEAVARLLDGVRRLVPAALLTVEDTTIVQEPPAQVRDLPRALCAADVMTRDVATVERDAPLRDVVERMLGGGYRAVPVVEDRFPVGIVTNTDLVRRGGLDARLELLARLAAPDRREALERLAGGGKTAGGVMTPDPVTVVALEPLRSVAALMVQRRLKRLPVVGSDGALVGMVSRLDLLRTVAAGDAAAAPDAADLGLDAAGPVSRIMRADAPVVHPETPLPIVLQAVTSTRLHRAVVVDAEGKVVGVVTDAEILERLAPAARGRLLRALMHRLPFAHPDAAEQEAARHAAARTAGELMVRDVPAVVEDLPVSAAIARMLKGNHKLLAVTDAGGRLVGIVDRADLLRGLLVRA